MTMTSHSKGKLLFSVTANDCEWKYTKGTGSGGQKKNKTSSAVHCIHRPSGAHGYSEASRSQLDNKRDAFQKMADSAEFKKWHHMETMRRTGQAQIIEEEVKREMKKIKVEIKNEEGRWTEVDKDAPLPDTKE
jgi:protein subunit release factor B